MTTNRHLSIVGMVISGDSDGRLDTTRNVAFVCVYLHQLVPGFSRPSCGLDSALESFLSFLLVMKAES